MKKFLRDFNIDDNSIIIVYMLINTIVLLMYLFTVAFNCEQFSFDVYKKIYMYYFLFQLIIFSLCIIHINVDEKFTLTVSIKNLSKIIILTFINVPLILTIFIVGNVQMLNIWIPLFVQLLYGYAVITLKQLIFINNSLKKYTDFMIHFIVFFINILSLVFLYMYYRYSQMVLTTIFDKRIPKIFFLNPLITTSGIINKEITNYTQLGIKPVLWAICFWSICIFINIIVGRNIYRRIGGHNIEMENC